MVCGQENVKWAYWKHVAKNSALMEEGGCPSGFPHLPETQIQALLSSTLSAMDTCAHPAAGGAQS